MRDDAFHHEFYDERVERLQPGGAKTHRAQISLAPGMWLLQVTVTAGLSNVNVTTRLASEHASGKLVGGTHNGAMSPYFGPATLIAFVDDLAVKSGQKVEIEITFEAVGPNAVALVGQRSLAVLARRHAPPVAKATPAAKAAAAAKVEAAKPVEAPAPTPPAAPAPAPAKPVQAKAEPAKPKVTAAERAPSPAIAKEPAKAPTKAAAAPAKPAPAPKEAAKPAKPAPAKPAPVVGKSAPAKAPVKKQANNKRK